jgi:hypothetical protein
MTDETAVDQAEPQSMEDRIAAQLGVTDEPEEAEENIQPEGADEAEAEPAEVEIEYEGERFKVPKQLEKAILQERDYTRKAQELADQRRQVEHEKQVTKAYQLDREFQQSVAAETQQLQGIENYLRHLEGVDVRALSLDDQIAHLAEISRVPRQREAIQKQIDEKRSKFDQTMQETINNIKQHAREALSKQIPGLNDEMLGSLRKYAIGRGFTEQDADGIMSDPRSSSVLYDAMRYRELQANKEGAVKKATAATPVIKPGSSNPMPQQVKDKLAYNKAMKAATTSQAKARLIEERLSKLF